MFRVSFLVEGRGSRETTLYIRATFTRQFEIVGKSTSPLDDPLHELRHFGPVPVQRQDVIPIWVGSAGTYTQLKRHRTWAQSPLLAPITIVHSLSHITTNHLIITDTHGGTVSNKMLSSEEQRSPISCVNVPSLAHRFLNQLPTETRKEEKARIHFLSLCYQMYLCRPDPTQPNPTRPNPILRLILLSSHPYPTRGLRRGWMHHMRPTCV